MKSNPLTLYQLNEHFRRVVALNYAQPVWVRAEVAQCNEARGHYYLDLVEKNDALGEIAAQSRATIWERKYLTIRRRIGGALLDTLLQEGIEIQVQVRVEFHERYGLSLHIEDIDEHYTLGKMALQRRQILVQLEEKKLLHKNKSISLSPVLQRFAIITSDRAAGWQDYLQHLETNIFGYKFQNTPFFAAMQGANTEPEILAQLRRITPLSDRFDAVLILRGGGAKMDLAAFDSLALAEAVANFPLPVLVGIGHETDETVLDIVAHSSLKTPTAVADFLINHALKFENSVASTTLLIQQITQQKLRENQFELQCLGQQFAFLVQKNSQKNEQKLLFLEQTIKNGFVNQLQKADFQLRQLENTVTALHPMQRGYTLVRNEAGEIRRRRSEVLENEVLVIEWIDGKVKK
jgi:exodeoxyribonuclease VII large subunit